MNLPDIQLLGGGNDFAESAAPAVMVAGALAERMHRPLILGHSADKCGQFPPAVPLRLRQADAPRPAREEVRLRVHGFVFDKKLLGGLSDDGLVNVAANGQAWLFVVADSVPGALGRTARSVLGNPAERIAQSSPVSTRVVRTGETVFGEGAGETDAQGFHRGRFHSDFRRGAAGPGREATRLGFARRAETLPAAGAHRLAAGAVMRNP